MGAVWLLLIWPITPLVVTVLFTRDYGRASCLGRDIHDTAEFLFVAPILAVAILFWSVLYGFWRLLAWPFQPQPKDHP